MTNVFLAGYTLFITSYLGDADYYDTKVVTGLTLEQAQAVEKFVRLCVSGYNYPDRSIYNSDSDKIDMERALTLLTVEDVSLLAEAIYSEPKNHSTKEVLEDGLVEFLGYSDPFTNYLRSFDELKITYFERDKHLQSTLIGA